MTESRITSTARMMLMFAAMASLALGVSGQQTRDDFVSVVEKRVRAWQPTKDERRIDEIAWASDLRSAQKLSREHQRPVFLFTYSGSSVEQNAMALQRC